MPLLCSKGRQRPETARGPVWRRGRTCRPQIVHKGNPARLSAVTRGKLPTSHSSPPPPPPLAAGAGTPERKPEETPRRRRRLTSARYVRCRPSGDGWSRGRARRRSEGGVWVWWRIWGGRWVQAEGTTGRRWVHGARNKGLCGRDSARRLRTGSRTADRRSWATACPLGAVPAASPSDSLPAPRRGPAQRHLLLRDPAAGPGAHDGAHLRQTVEPLL